MPIFDIQLYAMQEQELISLLALLNTEGIGDIVAKKLLNHCGTAENVFKASTSQLASIDGIGNTTIKKIKSKAGFNLAESEFNFISSNAISVHYFQSETYPDRLKHCIDSP